MKSKKYLTSVLLEVFLLVSVVASTALLGIVTAPPAAAAATAASGCAAGAGPDLSGRTLSPVDFAHTGHFWNITVNGEKFTFLRLSCANLRGTTLRGFDLTELTLTGADLTGADLHDVDVDRVLLDHANLTHANLSGLTFTQVYFTSTVIGGTDFSRADLGQASFTRMNLAGLVLSHANLSQADLTGANLTGTDLTGANLTQANLTNANLTNAKLDGAVFSQASMAGANLTGVHAVGTVFSQISDLDGVSLRGANLQKARFIQDSLKGADLREVDLTRAEISQSVLTGADITGATIAGVDWTQSRTGRVTTGNHLIGHFPLDAVVLAFILAIALFVLRSRLRMKAARVPAITVLAIIGAAFAWLVVAAAAYPEALRLREFLALISPLGFICFFIGGFVWIVHEDSALGWRSSLSLLVLLIGLYILLTTIMAMLQHPMLGGEAFQQACTAATCLGGFARGLKGLLLGAILALFGFILLARASPSRSPCAPAS